MSQAYARYAMPVAGSTLFVATKIAPAEWLPLLA
jgi:hypothetical protein